MDNKEQLKEYKKFDDILQEINIPDDAKKILIKKYKKILEEKNRIKVKELESILEESSVEGTDKLLNVYSKYVNNNIKHNHVKDIDSILFLSDMSNKKISKIKVQSCLKTKSFNFNKCIKFLKDTERLSIIIPNKYMIL